MLTKTNYPGVAHKEVEEITLDVCGLSCPGPIVSVSKRISELNEGDVVSVKATDPGFIRDIDSWCKNTGNILVSKEESKGILKAVIKKGGALKEKEYNDNVKEKTMIIFDGDLDKALAAFIIANGSVAMGNKVNMFFTFWGLSILRKQEPVSVKKDLISKMFGIMLPKGSKKLSLSKMNFGGMGSVMMRDVMKKKGISSLEELIKEAQESGVKMVACQMSMDVMGISKEELIDGVEIGGVATMLNDNDNSNMNLFI